MVILLSPAKRMWTDNNDIAYQDLPRFLDEAESLLDWLRGLTREELRKLWKCNDTILQENRVRLMAEHAVRPPEEIRAFDVLDYRFREAESDENTYVFLKRDGDSI